MGYSVPNTEEKINDALNALQNELNQPGMADAMRSLINAFHDFDNMHFEPKRSQPLFHALYNVENQLGLTNGKSEAELFPPEARAQKDFYAAFQSLWNTLSMYHELKQENPELVENISLAEFHANYSENYTQILIEQEMFEALKDIGRFGRDDRPEQYQTALKNLNLCQAGHKNGEPFTAKEFERIQAEANVLNLPFDPFGTGKSGLFVSSSIQSPEDLQNYIDRYETMLRDFLKKGDKSLHSFARQYEMEGDTAQKLTSRDLRRAAQQKQQADLIKADLPIYREYAELEKTAPIKDTFTKETIEASETFYQLNESSRQKFNDDAELKEAQAAYDQQRALCKEDMEKYMRLHRAAVKNADSSRETQNAYEVKKKLADYQLAIDLNRVDSFENFEKTRKGEATRIRQAADDYKKHMKEHMQEVRNFRTDIRKKIGDFSMRQRELIEMEDPWDDDQEKLNKETREYATKVKDKVNTFKAFRENEKNVFQQQTTTALENLQQSYVNEKSYRLKALKEATEQLKGAKKVMDDYYKASGAAAINNRKTKEVQQQIKEACDAMTSVKKFSFLGIGPNDSKSYTTMVEAVHGYLSGTRSVTAAHDACKAYLEKHTDTQGKLIDMSSELGKLRKQGCVRMMELLSQDPNFPTPVRLNAFGEAAKAKEKAASAEGERKKIDYEALKAELAEHSDKPKKGKGTDAKAYSNLNHQIEHLKEKEDKKKPKEKAPKMVVRQKNKF